MQAEHTKEEQLGKKIVEILNLKKNKNGKYNTTWGNKTMLGLGATMITIMEQHNANL